MYYLLLFILYPLSWLPFRVLYILSDTMYVVLYYIMGYRKELVLKNLGHAFTDKTQEELLAIRKQFYHNFCDQWIETIKLLSISEKQLNKRIKGNWEVFHQLYKDGLNCYTMLGHTFNWEWANVVCQYNCKQQFAGVYLPLNNTAFDQFMQRIRKSSGAWQISMKAKKAFSRLEGVHYIVGLMADQNPTNLKSVYWHRFMNREVPFFKGTEQIARRNKAAVVFAGIQKVKRGYYQITLERIVDDASVLPQYELTDRYIAFMERQLREQPENWLWTHKCWKHTKEQ